MEEVCSSHVPVIDFTKPDDELAERLYHALTTVGFACLTGTHVWQQVWPITV